MIGASSMIAGSQVRWQTGWPFANLGSQRDLFAPPYSTSFFISRTACSNPTMIARATMLWPMFSSQMPSMAAIGLTLR